MAVPQQRAGRLPLASIAMSEDVRCRRCGEVIGVYEPIVLTVGDGPSRRTSLALEGELPADAIAVHGDCHSKAAGSGRGEEP